MKRPTFNEKTAVKVVNKKSGFYGKRGTVTRVVGLDIQGNEIPAPYTPENYPISWMVNVKFDGTEYSFSSWESELEVVQHKFVDIDYIREEDIVLGTKPDGTPHIRPKNTGAFNVGDMIQISTKVDGANASISWDEATNKLEVFSRTNLLTSPGSLRGFYDYIKTVIEPKVGEFLKVAHQYVIFGEWLVPHTVKYNKEAYNRWHVYDIFHKGMNRYLPQCAVKDFCEKYGLDYVEVLYEGPFISWEHCRSFIGKSNVYGPQQEGIVIKNQTKILDSYGVKDPIYIKIVDEKFKEHTANKGHKQKEADPEKQAALAKSTELVESVVTEARVRKMICKLMDEGQLPSKIQPKDMGSVMKLLPKRIFEDVCAEELETVQLLGILGVNAGKYISQITAKLARMIIIGSK